jgi:hypothetical protein
MVSRLSIRTIQRVESGEPSNADTRRALARAFELEDIDIFNKLCNTSAAKQISVELEKFKREHVTLEARTVTSGQELIRLHGTADMYCASPAVELESDVAEVFAQLVDYLSDYRDCSDDMSEVDKLGASREVQAYLDRLTQVGFSLIYARRDTRLMSDSWANNKPLAMTIAYLSVFPAGSEPKLLIVSRHVRL